MGCQPSWLLKSRRISQTASMGASMTVLFTIFTIVSQPPRAPSAPSAALQLGFQRIEAALKHALADVLHQLARALWRALELRAPLCEGAVAVGDGRQLQSGGVVSH